MQQSTGTFFSTLLAVVKVAVLACLQLLCTQVPAGPRPLLLTGPYASSGGTLILFDWPTASPVTALSKPCMTCAGKRQQEDSNSQLWRCRRAVLAAA